MALAERIDPIFSQPTFFPPRTAVFLMHDRECDEGAEALIAELSAKRTGGRWMRWRAPSMPQNIGGLTT